MVRYTLTTGEVTGAMAINYPSVPIDEVITNLLKAKGMKFAGIMSLTPLGTVRTWKDNITLEHHYEQKIQQSNKIDH
tara:strand:+ start:23023 stop:23253 length:231 start_codon:yes stop_codon:yes gene_type:complete